MEEYVLQFRVLLDLLLSLALGFLIGFERKLRSKEAGIRTHTIVCFGSALMMLVSKYAFDGTADSSRVAAQIVSGIGFLGAGMIVYRQHEVRGLTTAAGVWATAGIGMACGGELYVIAVGATFLLIFVQGVLHLKVPVLQQKKTYAVNIVFVQSTDENIKIKQLFGIARFNKLIIHRENGQMIHSATLTTEKEFSATALNEIMESSPFILSLERCDNE